MTKQLLDNAMAGASAAGHLFAILVVGAVDAILLYALQIENNSFFIGVVSQDAANTITYIEGGMIAVPTIFIIAVIFSHWINEKSAANSGV